MLSRQQVDAYKKDGFILVEDAIRPDLLARMRAVIDGYVERSRSVTKGNDVYDLEDGHSAQAPRVRRLHDAVNRDPLFWEVIRDKGVIGPISQLIGPDIRLYGSKINMKLGGFGSPVEWHQDWAYYPHTNDDLLAIGVMIDDVTPENGPLLVVPGSHRGPLHDHHSDGYFVGAIEGIERKVDLSAAAPLVGRAGSMTVHHVRTVHGSASNRSSIPRRILFYEIAAADAWPIWTESTQKKYRDFAHFNEQMIVGQPTTQPRMTSVPVRIPMPTKKAKPSGLYEIQSEVKEKYFA
jgi:phytanoyl-CoA hydroxylase